MARSSGAANMAPTASSAPQVIAAAMSDVATAVLTLPYSFAPKYRETVTEQPVLHPKAKARKIYVIS